MCDNCQTADIQKYLYGMDEFLKIPIWIEPDTDDDDSDPILNSKYYRRYALIPLDMISYMHEGLDKKTTEICLKDGELLVDAETYQIIFETWATWYTNRKNNFVSFSLRNN